MKLRTVFKLALAAVLGLAAQAQAATSYTPGDLFIGFRGPTGTPQNLLINIGQASNFVNATSPVTIDLGVTAALDTAFDDGATNWYDRSNLFVGIIGGYPATVGTDPANTIYASRNRGTAWARRPDNQQGSTTSLVGAMVSFFQGNTAVAGNANGLLQTAGSANSYASFQPGGANSGGISFQAYDPSIEGTPKQTLFLYRLTPDTGVPGTAGEVLVGTFTLSSSAVLTFTPAVDTAPGVNRYYFEQSTYSVREDVGSHAVALTVVREGDLTAATSVVLNTTDGTAVAGTNFTSPNPLTINFPIGSSSQTITIPVTDVSTFTGDLAFTATLSSPSGSGTVGSPATASVTIIESDLAPAGSVQFTSTSSTSGSTDGNGAPSVITIPVSRTAGTFGTVTVPVTVDPSSTLPNTSYTVDSQVVFGDGETEALITVTLIEDAGEVETGTLVLALGTPVGAPNNNATLGANTTHTLTVVPSTAISFSSSTYSAAEGNANFVVTLRRSGSAGEASVALTVTNGTADTADYTLASGNPTVVTWANGDATDKTVSFSIANDGAAEGSQTLNLALGTPTGSATLGTPNTAVLTIVDPDSVPPTITLTSPKAGAKLSGADIVVSGTATDNTDGAGIDRVDFELNGVVVGSTVPSGAGAFSGNIIPEQGANTLRVIAYDLAGASSFKSVTFTFTNVRTNLVGNYNGLLRLNETFPIPDDEAATYNGLLSVSVTATGTFTGKISLGGVALPIGGTILSNGDARFKIGATTSNVFPVVKGRAPNITSLGFLSFTLNPTTFEITAQLLSDDEEGDVLAAGVLERAVYTAARNPVLPFKNVGTDLIGTADKGIYTVIFPPAATNDPSVLSPEGYGTGTLSISTAGIAKINGKLADGTPVIFSSPISGDNSVPFYLPLYTSTGYVIGELVFADEENSDATGSLLWVKPANLPKQVYYPAGWPEGIDLDFAASRYVAPSTRAGAANPNTVLGLGLVGSTSLTDANIEINFNGGALPNTPVENPAVISPANKVTVLYGGDSIALKAAFVPANGALSGSFIHPRTGKAVAFTGHAFQKTNEAFGYFLFTPPTNAPVGTPALSGSVEVTPAQ